jgi:hypothetical protein
MREPQICKFLIYYSVDLPLPKSCWQRRIWLPHSSYWPLIYYTADLSLPKSCWLRGIRLPHASYWPLIYFTVGLSLPKSCWLRGIRLPHSSYWPLNLLSLARCFWATGSCSNRHLNTTILLQLNKLSVPGSLEKKTRKQNIFFPFFVYSKPTLLPHKTRSRPNMQEFKCLQ